MGNKDIEFVVERRYFLERFFMQISEIEYLKSSEEMRIFIRPELNGLNTDVDKSLLKMNKPTVNDLIPLYKKSFKLTDKTIEE